MERYDEAIEAYQRALEIEPDHYLSHVYTGMSYIGKRDCERAIDTYQAAADLWPDDPLAYYHLGEAYLAQGYFRQAYRPY